MNATARIQWSDTLHFASDVLSRGYYGIENGPSGEFTVKFIRGADGRSVRLRHNSEYVGSFRTVGAAKRRAVQIAKAVQS